MANHWFNQFKGSLEKGVVMLDGYVQLDASAAVVNEKGVRGGTVSKTGTGLYQLVLDSEYPALLSAALTPFSFGTSANQVWKVVSLQDSNNNFVSLISGGSGVGPKVRKINLACCNSSGVPTNPAVASGVSVSLVLKNSSVK